MHVVVPSNANMKCEETSSNKKKYLRKMKKKTQKIGYLPFCRSNKSTFFSYRIITLFLSLSFFVNERRCKRKIFELPSFFRGVFEW